MNFGYLTSGGRYYTRNHHNKFNNIQHRWRKQLGQRLLTAIEIGTKTIGILWSIMATLRLPFFDIYQKIALTFREGENCYKHFAYYGSRSTFKTLQTRYLLWFTVNL